MNEFATDIVRHHPGRFGFFATLTLPDVEGSIAEASHALDRLGADGVVLLTNVGGAYLGEQSWDPLVHQPNARRAVVFTHLSVLPAPEVAGIPPYAADFLLDTTRAAINIARVGTFEKFPELQIILSHAGGFAPYAAERIARACTLDGTQRDGLDRLRRFYFDTALSGRPYTLPSILVFADPEHSTFGNDWPYARLEDFRHFTQQLDRFPLTEGQRSAISRTNAESSFHD